MNKWFERKIANSWIKRKLAINDACIGTIELMWHFSDTVLESKSPPKCFNQIAIYIPLSTLWIPQPSTVRLGIYNIRRTERSKIFKGMEWEHEEINHV